MSDAGQTEPAAQKKRLIATERDEARRAAWRAQAARLDPAQVVFVDESSTHVSLTRLRARAPRGQRATGRVPRNHDPRLSLVAAMTPAGMGPAMTLPGAVDTPAFVAYVREALVPTLHPGQLVVLDNLSVHKAAEVRRLIEHAGCQLLFLPPYSPDLAPIELAFSKLKAYLRGVGARTQAALEQAIGEALAHITAADAHGWFGHCGYPLPAQPP